MARKAAPKKMKQATLPAPGMKADVHPDIEELGESYIEIQEQRRQLAAEAKDQKAAIIDAMKKHGVEVYRVEQHTFELSVKDVVKLKKQKEPTSSTSHLDD